MMLCCPNCGGRFFRTLDRRVQLLQEKIEAMLLKKRCKRCKEKLVVRVSVQNGVPCVAFASLIQWQTAKRLTGPGGLFQSTVFTPVVSDYTLLISSDTGRVFDKILRRDKL